MRLGPATQAALLSRTFCLISFAVAKDIAQLHSEERHASMLP
jgi:hypothetical protein